MFEFGDVDCNSHEPRLANAFDTEAKAREWLQQCADGTGALCADAVDVLAYAGGFWMVWYSDRSGGYYCQYVAQRADASDLSGALMQCEALNLRQRLYDFKREHLARQMAEKLANLKEGEVYAVDYDGEGVNAKIDRANTGCYEVTFWSFGEMKERHTNRTAAEAAQAVADFVAVYVPASVWISQRYLLHTFKIDEIPYYSGPEKSPISQDVETHDHTTTHNSTAKNLAKSRRTAANGIKRPSSGKPPTPGTVSALRDWFVQAATAAAGSDFHATTSEDSAPAGSASGNTAHADYSNSEKSDQNCYGLPEWLHVGTRFVLIDFDTGQQTKIVYHCDAIDYDNNTVTITDAIDRITGNVYRWNSVHWPAFAPIAEDVENTAADLL